MHRISKSLLILIVVVSLLATAIAATAIRTGERPVVFGINPSVAYSGDTVQCTVTLDAATTEDLSLTVSQSSPCLFSSLPATVTVPAGQDHVIFSATLSSSASGTSSLSASANGGY